MLIYGFIRIHREDKSYQDKLTALRGKKLISNHPEAPHEEWLKEEMANNSNIKTLSSIIRGKVLNIKIEKTMSRIRMKTMKYVLLGFFSLITLSAFSSEEHSNNSANNTTDSDDLIISVYSGVGNGNFGVDPRKGIGTEWMYKNLSIDLGFGKGEDFHDSKYIGTSVGVKIYSSYDNEENKVFVGFTHMHDYYDNSYYKDIPHKNNAITAGYRYTSSSGIYLSPYAGLKLKKEDNCHNGLPCMRWIKRRLST